MYTQKMYAGMFSNTHVHIHTGCRCWHKYAWIFCSAAHTPHHSRIRAELAGSGLHFPGVTVASHLPTGDFLLLLCASQQWQVFSAERTEEWRHMAGVNTDRLEPLRGEPNPVPNFIHCRWGS